MNKNVFGIFVCFSTLSNVNYFNHIEIQNFKLRTLSHLLFFFTWEIRIIRLYGWYLLILCQGIKCTFIKQKLRGITNNGKPFLKKSYFNRLTNTHVFRSTFVEKKNSGFVIKQF